MVSGLAVYEPIAWIGLDHGKTIPEKGDQGIKGGAQALKTSPLVVFEEAFRWHATADQVLEP